MVKSVARAFDGSRCGDQVSVPVRLRDDLSPERSGRRRGGTRRGAGQAEKFDQRGNKHNLYPVRGANETAFRERVDLVKRADRAARAFDPRIFQVQAVYADNLRQVLVATSEGTLSVDRQPL